MAKGAHMLTTSGDESSPIGRLYNNIGLGAEPWAHLGDKQILESRNVHSG